MNAGRTHNGGPKSDINVTPLVDVMLVLLIIMLVIAPMIHRGAGVALPEAANTAEKADRPEQTIVAVDARGAFYVNALPVANADLVPRVQKALGDKKEKLVYVKGDRDATYAAIMDAMDALRTARIENIALITEHKPGPGNPAGMAR
jgi:biopolymer transport protein ExbD